MFDLVCNDSIINFSFFLRFGDVVTRLNNARGQDVHQTQLFPEGWGAFFLLFFFFFLDSKNLFGNNDEIFNFE